MKTLLKAFPAHCSNGRWKERYICAERIANRETDLKKQYQGLWSRAPKLADWKEILQTTFDALSCFRVRADKEARSDFLVEAFGIYKDLLITRKLLSKLDLPFPESIKEKFDCGCENCQDDFFRQHIGGLMLAAGITLLSAEAKALKESAETASPHDSLTGHDRLPTESPFEVLGLPESSSKGEVLRRVMELMKSEPERMAAVRKAQSFIFDTTRISAFRFFKVLERSSVPQGIGNVKEKVNPEIVKRLPAIDLLPLS